MGSSVATAFSQTMITTFEKIWGWRIIARLAYQNL